MTFGLRNAVKKFQGFIDGLLRYLDCSAYLDDNLVASEDEQDQEKDLGKLFRHLHEFGIVIKGDKCIFVQSELSFLGYKITREGIFPIQEFVLAYHPTTVSELRRILALLKPTKPEEPDEGATYKEKLDLQLRKDRCYALIYANISSDLKNLITETTDGVVAWKILKDHFEPVARARVSQLLDEFFGTRYQPGEDVGIFISRVKTAATRLQEAGHKLDDVYIGFQLIRWLPQEFQSTVQQIYRWKEEDFKASKIEAELILEANRLQLMKQDLEKAKNAYLSNFTSKKSDISWCYGCSSWRSKQKANSNLRFNLNLPDYDDEEDEDDFDRVKDSLASRLFSKTCTETPSTSEKPDVSSDNHSLIPCTEVKWIRNICRKVTGSNAYITI
ncbi:retrovirus-related Pol polyprotein from transposon TNT 1-94 [Trichonephila inaurata madagascariensis]|uniref:Retrovirus-related Pol polyprotein from transposon TNT 1-94 n=1 Tax=Trichonephila inaurata madagascariensis TaxID=2747483 RepID=A0A8X7C6A3_9ARAC|nr:retrovirus-related Pol polyprotein from transposon TNT 1-94 [Trichonephila inaurata madagascariensis]